MKIRLIKYIFSFIILLSVLSQSAVLSSNNDSVDITKSTDISAVGFSLTENLTNKKEGAGAVCADGGSIILNSSSDIGSIYIIFNELGTSWTVKNEENAVNFEKSSFLHEFINISENFGDTKTVTIEFFGKFDISEIYVFSSGEKPDWVQTWQKPTERADLLLFATHSDDDQLYFAGLIPYYTALGYNVQIAYLTYHPKEILRRHELLNGLWTAGAVNYPIYESFPDFRIDDLAQTIERYEKLGVKYSELEGYVISTIRQTKPQVIVSHDINGEYGHGMHILLSKIIRDSVEICPDETKYTESAEKYGTWQSQKIYLHLYNDNEIVLDAIDEPLDSLGGKTPFQVSQDAFMKHKSQHWAMFYKWLYGTEKNPIKSSTQIRTYNPSYYGLYDTKVGADVSKNDMFENLISYAEQDKIKQEAQEKQEELDSVSSSLSDVLDKISSLEESVNELKDKNNSQEEKIKENESTISNLQKKNESLLNKNTVLSVVTILLITLLLLSVIILIMKCKKSKT